MQVRQHEMSRCLLRYTLVSLRFGTVSEVDRENLSPPTVGFQACRLTAQLAPSAGAARIAVT